MIIYLILLVLMAHTNAPGWLLMPWTVGFLWQLFCVVVSVAKAIIDS
jgi:hypothetical protein